MRHQVPLETTLVAETADMTPHALTRRREGHRACPAVDDTLTVAGKTLPSREAAKPKCKRQADRGCRRRMFSRSDAGADDALVAQHRQPAEFTVFPSKAAVHIMPAPTLSVGGLTAHGYTVRGLICGYSGCCGLMAPQNLIALV